MRSAEKVLPSRASTPQQGADLRETIGDLTEGEELRDLVDASLSHQPGYRANPVGR